MQNFYSVCILSALTVVGYVQVKAFPTDMDVQCGKLAQRKGRILNGEFAEDGKIPWMASIKLNGGHRCGGSIISNRYILSAAHCFVTDLLYYMGNKNVLNGLTVTLGEFNQTEDESYSKSIEIKNIIFHPNYTKTPLRHDIVLLELTHDIQWSNYIRPICLPDVDIRTRDTAFASGWGTDIYIDYFKNAKLRFVEMTIYDNADCNKRYTSSNLKTRVDNNQMCAGTPPNQDLKVDTTTGDSGGPLYIDLDGRSVLVGVTSFGTGESLKVLPGIYTRVYEYLDWINKYIRKPRINDKIPNWDKKTE